MANSVYWKNCIREIRHSVYGRDNRKPIADAISTTRTWNEGQVKHITEEAIEKLNEVKTKAIEAVEEMDPTLDEMEDKLQRAVGSFTPEPVETWYTYDYRDIKILDIQDDDHAAEVVTNQIFVNYLGDPTWDSFDITFDEADFTFNDPPLLPNDYYELIDEVSDDFVRRISEDSYTWNIPNPIDETHIHHGADYVLTITRINGS